MGVVFKCHNKECEKYPCYLSGGLKVQGILGEYSVGTPFDCPFDECGETADWKEVPYRKDSYFGDVLEFIEGEGFDNLPPYFENLFFGDGIRVDSDYYVEKLANALQDRSKYPTIDEKDGINNLIKKMKKEDIIKAVFPSAFRMGLAYGEYLRQTKGKEYEEMCDGD